MVFNETEPQERAYLQQVLRRIRNAIRTADASVKEHVDTLQEHKAYIWSNKDIDPHEIRSMRESILTHFALGENVIARRKRLGKLLDIPYFGRIDFCEKKAGRPVLPVYIGVHTFYDSACQTPLIHDWRAPISGLFYDGELGEASFPSPAGKVRGTVSLKRQYRIRNGRMEYLIESSLAVHDDILQKELSLSTDEKMRNIVATIQREQNRIIRNEEASVLIIQGVAGSGKTSVALHRIAYLLYASKGNLSSGNILILSPNRVFADYISNVLPELGEESVPGTSMEQILSGVLEHPYNYQTFFEQVAALLDGADPEMAGRISYKSSFEFLAQLDRFLLYVENHCFHAVAVKLTPRITVPAEWIGEQFKRFHRYPMRRRFEAMAGYIVEQVEIDYRFTVTAVERNALKKELRKMFTGNKDLALYKAFFDWVGKPEMYKVGKNRTLEYADLAPLAYLHLALEGNPSHSSRIQHLLMDEMQDYSPIQYKVIRKLYPCRKTILGDASQSVIPYGSSTADDIQKVFVTGAVTKLCKSYRSTWEITDFAQKIRANDEIEPVARHGENPRIQRYGSAEEELSGIADLLSAFRDSTYQSLGIICKTELQASELAGKLTTYSGAVVFLSSRSAAFVNGIVVTFAHLAKGLEFDEVVIPFASRENYHSEMDRGMLYVAVTRAMHKLTLTYSGTRSELLP